MIHRGQHCTVNDILVVVRKGLAYRSKTLTGVPHSCVSRALSNVTGTTS
jgi:hypothetical protein